MQFIINIFQYIGQVILYPVCYILQIIGMPLTDDFKSNSFFKMLVGIISVTAMLVAVYVLPMFKGKKKRRYTKKTSRRRKRK